MTIYHPMNEPGHPDPEGNGARRSAQWGLDNCYMLARRELARLRRVDERDVLEVTRERWEHVVRICEEAGVQKTSVLRDAVPTEITGG